MIGIYSYYPNEYDDLIATFDDDKLMEAHAWCEAANKDRRNKWDSMYRYEVHISFPHNPIYKPRESK